MDLPGYGYAKANESVKAQWGKMIEDYLHTREQLVQQCKMNNGEDPTETKVSSMLRNWKRQGLIVNQSNGYAKKK